MENGFNTSSAPKTNSQTNQSFCKFNDRSLFISREKIERLFCDGLTASEKEIVDMIQSGDFFGNDACFLEEISSRGMLPEIKLAHTSNLPESEYIENICNSHTKIIAGRKTVGLLDIQGSSKMDSNELKQKMIKMYFILNLFENIFKSEGFTVIAPSFGDEGIIGILGVNAIYDDLAILGKLYELIKKCGLDINFFFDKAYIDLNQFLFFTGENSIQSINIGGVTKMCHEYFRLRKGGGISKYIGSDFLDDIQKETGAGSIENTIKSTQSKVGRTIRKRENAGKIFSEKAFDDFMLGGTQENKEIEGTHLTKRLLMRSEIGKMLYAILRRNTIPEHLFACYEKTDEDMEIIHGGNKNDSIFLIDGITQVYPLIGREKKLTGGQLMGEGSFLQGYKSIANASCIIEKGTEYIKIPHSFIESIIKRVPLKISDNQSVLLQVDPIEMSYITDFFQKLNARRLGENFKNKKVP